MKTNRHSNQVATLNTTTCFPKSKEGPSFSKNSIAIRKKEKDIKVDEKPLKRDKMHSHKQQTLEKSGEKPKKISLQQLVQSQNQEAVKSQSKTVSKVQQKAPSQTFSQDVNNCENTDHQLLKKDKPHHKKNTSQLTLNHQRVEDKTSCEPYPINIPFLSLLSSQKDEVKFHNDDHNIQEENLQPHPLNVIIQEYEVLKSKPKTSKESLIGSFLKSFNKKTKELEAEDDIQQSNFNSLNIKSDYEFKAENDQLLYLNPSKAGEQTIKTPFEYKETHREEYSQESSKPLKKYEAFDFKPNMLSFFYPKLIQSNIKTKRVSKSDKLFSVIKAPSSKAKLQKVLKKMKQLTTCQESMRSVIFSRIDQKSKQIQKNEQNIYDKLKKKNIYLDSENFDIVSILQSSQKLLQQKVIQMQENSLSEITIGSSESLFPSPIKTNNKENGKETIKQERPKSSTNEKAEINQINKIRAPRSPKKQNRSPKKTLTQKLGALKDMEQNELVEAYQTQDGSICLKIKMPQNSDPVQNQYSDLKQDFPNLTSDETNHLNVKSYLELGFSHSEPVNRFGVAHNQVPVLDQQVGCMNFIKQEDKINECKNVEFPNYHDLQFHSQHQSVSTNYRSDFQLDYNKKHNCSRQLEFHDDFYIGSGVRNPEPEYADDEHQYQDLRQEEIKVVGHHIDYENIMKLEKKINQYEQENINVYSNEPLNFIPTPKFINQSHIIDQPYWDPMSSNKMVEVQQQDEELIDGGNIDEQYCFF